MQIYLVEDSAVVRARLVELLESVPGTRVIGSASGAKAAIDEILALRPEVVITDLSLAEGSGFDVLRAVCHRAPEIDFYMLSNFAADPYRQLAERLGARHFFDKTREFGRVRELIARRAVASQ